MSGVNKINLKIVGPAVKEPYPKEFYNLKPDYDYVSLKEEQQKTISRLKNSINQSRIKWDKQRVIIESNNIYGENMLDYSEVPELIGSETKFLIKCAKCLYMWVTNVRSLVKNRKGCSYCNKGKFIPFTKYTFLFLSYKIYKNQLNYSLIKNINSKKKNVNLICNFCGFTFESSIHSMLRNKRGCPICNSNGKIYANYYNVTFRFKRLYGNKYKYLNLNEENAKVLTTKIRILCKECDYIFIKTINEHLSNFGCPSCSNRIKWRGNLKRLVDIGNKVHSYKYDYSYIKSEDVETANSLVRIKCNICDKTFSQTIQSHIKGHGCRYCAGNAIINYDLFIDKVSKIYGDEFDYRYINSEDINSSSNILVVCKICLKSFNTVVSSFLKSRRKCPHCTGNVRWTRKKFLNVVKNGDWLKSFSYNLVNLDKLENQETIIPIICNECNKTFHRSLSDHFIRGYGCNFCIKSYKSKQVQTILEKNGIMFTDEFNFPGSLYRYDYLIYPGNYIDNTIIIPRITIIEYDGRQHFDRNKMWNNVENFQKARERDIIKQKIALEKNYKIIRICYKIPFKDIENFIISSLNDKKRIIYSHPEMYSWLK